MTHNRQSPPHFATTPTAPDDEGELALYELHNLLHGARFKLHPPALAQRAEIAGALSYLDSRDPTRAALVRRCLRMAAVMAKEAAELVNESLDWATIERLFAPEDAEFQDSPQHWLAIARNPPRPVQSVMPTAPMAATAPTGEVTAAASNPEETPAEAAPVPDTVPVPPSPRSEETAHPEDVWPDPMPPRDPLPTPRKASLQKHGRTLRDECNAEQRRFYAIAGAHGLPTGNAAGDAIREALSELFQIPIASRRDLTARQWSQAASAIETQDLHWTTQPKHPKPKAASNGHSSANGHPSANGTSASNGHARPLRP